MADKKTLRNWKKAYTNDLSYIVDEMKSILDVPSTIILSGEVGAGKTTFCQMFVGDEEVLSPTYSLISEAPGILHADFYRVKDKNEITLLELESYLDDKDYFLVEWGRGYLQELFRETGEGFTYYELDIEVGEKQEGEETPYRNYILSQLKLL